MRAKKPPTADGYSPDQVRKVEAACLYLATRLGDLMDETCVVGGLVPTLLIGRAADASDRHVGTLDLDVGLALGILQTKRYQEIAERLRSSGFRPDKNEQGNETFQRWVAAAADDVTLDFLIPSTEGETGGTLKHLEADLAAVVTPGLELAFRDRTSVLLRGRTLVGEQAERNVWVCGPAAFVLLKALAFHNRGENKDAYDLYYVIRHFGLGPGGNRGSASGILASRCRDPSGRDSAA